MPQLDGLSIIAFLSFGVLVVVWLVAPNTTVDTVEVEAETIPAAA
jgi:hypothetical protein